MLTLTLTLCLRSASLLTPADVQFVQDTPPPLLSAPPATTTPGVGSPTPSRQLVRAELEQLRAQPAPSIAGGIVLIAVGVPLLAIGAVFGVYGLAFAFAGGGSLVSGLGITLLLVAAVFLVPAVICIAVGIPVLSRSLAARKERNRKLRELEQQLQLEPEAPPNAPPPLPPTSVSIDPPRVLLATF